jgi:hypothetical protein
MFVEETFYRGPETGRESRSLAAPIYNLARILLGRSTTGSLFVPIRGMQYLAVLDTEEFIFVDRERGHLIDLAWREFRAHERASLTEPIAYQAVYYTATAPGIMGRLHSEFARALESIDERQAPRGSARIVRLGDA